MTAEDQRMYGATPVEMRAYKDFMLKQAVRRMLRAEERAYEAQEKPWDHRLNLEDAWWSAYRKYRKQVEKMIA